MTDVAILWWVLSALAVIFILVDWGHAPIDRTMHIGFVLITAFMGPLGLILYLLTVREPLPGTHAQYIASRWKQVVGSTLHCVAGDSVGIVGAALITRHLHLPMTGELLIEYAAGFLVGWLVFQALFMKDMAGGSYVKAVRTMFLPEWLSMNGVMAGMAVVMVVWMKRQPGVGIPVHPVFWFMMSMALIAGAVVAYPINWWLVSHHVKHGLMSTAGGTSHHAMSMGNHRPEHGASKPEPRMAQPRVHAMQGGSMTATKAAGSYAASVVLISVALLVASLALSMWMG